MKRLTTILLVTAVLFMFSAQAASIAVGSVTPQAQFMSNAREQAHTAAKAQADEFAEQIKDATLENDADRKAHKLVSDKFASQRETMVHAARQEANELLIKAVPNTTTVTMTKELQQKLNEVYAKTKVAFAQQMMKMLEGVESEVGPAAAA